MSASPSKRECDTFDCESSATHRAEWEVAPELRGKPGFEGSGYYCDDCAECLSNGSNVFPLAVSR